jgi:hypothetical protein
MMMGYSSGKGGPCTRRETVDEELVGQSKMGYRRASVMKGWSIWRQGLKD